MIYNLAGAAPVVNMTGYSSAGNLPSTARDNDLAFIGGYTPEKITVSATTPESPAANDIFIRMKDDASRLVTVGRGNSKIVLPVLAVYRYTGTEWEGREAYYGVGGAWVKIDQMPPLGTALNSCTWPEIQAIGVAGLAQTYFQVGATKSITLTTGVSVTLRIIGFNHDTHASTGNKAVYTFDTVGCLAPNRAVASVAYFQGNYSTTDIHAALTETIYPTLPEALSIRLKTVKKQQASAYPAATVAEFNTKIFLLSERELFGVNPKSGVAEGTQYAYYTSDSRRVKKDASNNAVSWLTRSPYSNGGWTGVSTTGAADGFIATNAARGVAFGLCL